MIDLKLLRERADEVIAIYRERLFDETAAGVAQKLVELDAKRRQAVGAGDDLKQKRNAASAAVGREKDPAQRARMIAEMEDFKGAIARQDEELARLDEEMQRLALELPNLPDPSVPAGRSDAEN